MERQDETLEHIQGTLSVLAEQAGLMGKEIGEHNEFVFYLSFSSGSKTDIRMLEDLESGVDDTQTKLSTSMRKLQKFIRDTEGSLLQASRPFL
jgi:hypothetical protein